MIALTYFPSLRNANGQRVRTSWEKLLSRLSIARVVSDKHDAPGLSLATFAGDRRALANVELVYAVGLDLDERVDWDMLLHLFDATDSIVHTTWSSTSDDLRARVFIRLSRPVTATEYRRVYTAASERMQAAGLVVDRQASDPSRFWFLPATPPGGTYRYSIGRGKPLHVDSALVAYPDPAPPRPIAHAPRPVVAGNEEDRARRYVAKMPAAISGSGGHAATFAVARKLVADFELDDGAAWSILCEYNERCEPPWSERQLRHKLESAQRARVRNPMRRAS